MEKTPEQARADIMQGLKLVLDGYRTLIAAELAPGVEAFDAAESAAADRLGDCIAALVPGEQVIADLTEQLEYAEARIAACVARQEDGDENFKRAMDSRTRARIEGREYEEEAFRLRQKIEFAQAERLPLIDARNAATRDMQSAQNSRLALESCMTLPFLSPIGKATDAYKLLQMDVEWLLGGVARTIDVDEETLAALAEFAIPEPETPRPGAIQTAREITSAVRRARGLDK